jgi:hypothetical protein
MTDNPEQYIHYPQPQEQPPQLPYLEAPQPGVIPLRPLDVGAMINGSFKAVFRNWRSAILLPFLLSLIAMAVTIVPALLLLAKLPAMTTGARPSSDAIAAFFGSFALVLLVVMVMLIGASMVTQTTVTVVVSRAVLGRATSMGQALRAAAPRMLPLLGLTLLIGLVWIACGFVPFVVILVLAYAANAPGLVALAFLVFMGGMVVGLYLSISWALAAPALILEPAPVLTAMRRSRWLVSGGWWRVFGILLLVGVMVGVASNLAQLPVNFVQFSQLSSIMPTRAGAQPDPTAVLGVMFSPTVIVLTVVLTAVVSAIGQPFSIGVTTLLYHDLRIRKESFHLPLWQMSQLPDELAVSPAPTARPEPTM